MNSLFKKFLFYNILGFLLLGILSILIIILSNNYQLNKRLSLIQTQALISYNYINSINFQKVNIENLSKEELYANLELKNLSIIIIDKDKNIFFDSKGYDLAKEGFISEKKVSIGEEVNIIDNELEKEGLDLGRNFLVNKKFESFFKKSYDGSKSKFSITLDNNQLLLFSIFPFEAFEENLFIVAYEDNSEINVINEQVRLNIFLSFLAIILSLMIFSIFLNFFILQPIKILAQSAADIGKNLKSKPKIDELGKRQDEIGDLSKTLNEMLENLYEKINDTEKYSADLMHEIRNPLASIKMASEVIYDKTDQDYQKFIEMIEADIMRIENIITDYSAMIKDEARLSTSESKIFNIKELMEEIINEYKKLNINNIGFATISDNSADDKFNIKGQSSFLRQAIQNIIDNAISFSNNGDQITLNLSSTSNYISLSISDNGPGIKEPIFEKIFERFYSLRDNDDNLQIHSGLGLNIAKQIVDSHQGYISANNLLDNDRIIGARFIINLPIAK